jgi:hypothetical protein
VAPHLRRSSLSSIVEMQVFKHNHKYLCQIDSLIHVAFEMQASPDSEAARIGVLAGTAAAAIAPQQVPGAPGGHTQFALAERIQMAHVLYSALERPDQERAKHGNPGAIPWGKYKRRGTISPVSVAVRELKERFPDSFAWRSEPALRRAIKVWFLRSYGGQRLAASITDMHNRPRGPVRTQLTPEDADNLK